MNQCESKSLYTESRGEEGLSLRAEILTPYQDKARRINIEQLDRGYIVGIGCQNMVVEDVEVLIAKLTDYLRSPNATEKKYLSGVKEFFK